MLVVPSKHALVFKAKNPEQILACIPTAKRFTHKGTELMYVPHRLDETKVLRNLGANVAGPIQYYYDFPYRGGRKPFKHQRVTSDFLTQHMRCAVLNQMRTGKTSSCIWTADYLIKQGAVRKVLIIAPLSTLDFTWAQSLFESVPHHKYAVLHGSREKRIKLIKENVRFYIVNHDGFKIVAPYLPEDIDLVIFDEAAVLRNPGTGRHKTFAKFVEARPTMRLWLLTGTPTPNEPTDAWALCKLIGAPVPRYSAFREMVMQKVSTWTWRPRHDAAQTVSEYLQPSILFRRDDCFDLPDIGYETRKCELSAEQRKMFNDLMRKLAAETQGQQVTAVNEAAKIQKLLQVLLGVVYADDDSNINVDCSARTEVIREIIEEAGEKAIVFVPFTGALEAIAEELGKTMSVAVVNGGVSMSARSQIFRDFTDNTDPRVLVADARTMSHGIDLSAASIIIWAGPTNSNETYEQACARILGPKQKHKATIFHIEATEVERRIFNRLRDKQSLQGLLLDLIQAKS